MIMSDFRSRRADDIQYMLAAVHGDTYSHFASTTSTSGVRIYGGVGQGISDYNISSPDPFSYSSGGIDRAVAILRCVAGFAEIHIGGNVTSIRPGQIIIIGSNKEYHIICNESFSYNLTLLFDNIVHNYCEKLTNKSIEGPLVFDVAFASERFSSNWSIVSEGIGLLLTHGEPCPSTIGSIVDYAVALLLEMHPHNCSASVSRGNFVSPELIRKARRFVDQNAHRAICAADVASFVGCGMRALHHGFCDHLGQPPRAFIYGRGSAGTEASSEESATANGLAQSGSGGLRNPRRGGEPSTETAARKFAQLDVLWTGRPGRSSGTLSSLKIGLLRHHINASLHMPMTVGDLSRIVGMSSRRFATAFRRAFGTSPAQYVIWERLKWACWLLVNTDQSIASIAWETGFSSQSYLTTTLKGWNGQTPRELRNLSRSQFAYRDKVLFGMT